MASYGKPENGSEHVVRSAGVFLRPQSGAIKELRVLLNPHDEVEERRSAFKQDIYIYTS